MKKAIVAACVALFAVTGCAGIVRIDEVTDFGNDLVKLYCKGTLAEQALITEKVMFKFEAGQITSFDLTCAAPVQ